MTGCTVPACEQPPVGFYVVGERCQDHTPARQAGRPEPESLVDPERTLDALRAAAGVQFQHMREATAVIDQRHRDKGQAVSPERRRLWREAEMDG